MAYVFELMRAKIRRSDLTDPEVVAELQRMVDILYIGGRLTADEYQELVGMLVVTE